jgi:hypothetical protein
VRKLYESIDDGTIVIFNYDEKRIKIPIGAAFSDMSLEPSVSASVPPVTVSDNIKDIPLTAQEKLEKADHDMAVEMQRKIDAYDQTQSKASKK